MYVNAGLRVHTYYSTCTYKGSPAAIHVGCWLAAAYSLPALAVSVSARFSKREIRHKPAFHLQLFPSQTTRHQSGMFSLSISPRQLHRLFEGAVAEWSKVRAFGAFFDFFSCCHCLLARSGAGCPVRVERTTLNRPSSTVRC